MSISTVQDEIKRANAQGHTAVESFNDIQGATATVDNTVLSVGDIVHIPQNLFGADGALRKRKKDNPKHRDTYFIVCPVTLANGGKQTVAQLYLASLQNKKFAYKTCDLGVERDPAHDDYPKGSVPEFIRSIPELRDAVAKLAGQSIKVTDVRPITVKRYGTDDQLSQARVYDFEWHVAQPNPAPTAPPTV